ncbi:MAG: hypothetical protein HQL27_06030 [Candidatus Omnitrophica bacterium]|nr:hypothetical protein [Candidatus Omnitrophota bacterium]
MKTNEAKQSNGSLKVTPIHRVLSKGEWIEIGKLKVGDTLTNTKGTDVKIESIKEINEEVNIYNFDVEQYHTYAVSLGNEEVIVHNRKQNMAVMQDEGGYQYRGGNYTYNYYYDGNGRRLKAFRNGVTTKYLYGADGNLLAEANEAGEIQRYYIYGANGLLAMIIPAPSLRANVESEAISPETDRQAKDARDDDEVYTYHFDGSGNAIALTDINQQIVNSYAYTPFGEILSKSEIVSNPFLFGGQCGIICERRTP